jgi:hypothetical protein
VDSDADVGRGIGGTVTQMWVGGKGGPNNNAKADLKALANCTFPFSTIRFI